MIFMTSIHYHDLYKLPLLSVLYKLEMSNNADIHIYTQVNKCIMLFINI